jgi:hypothetical protein
MVPVALIRLRNEDTKLFWGRPIVDIGDDDPAGWDLAEHEEPLANYLDLRTSKTDAGLSGPLAPILTPFLDAPILRGRNPRLCSRSSGASREMEKAAVVPNSDGTARGAPSLSEGWSGSGQRADMALSAIPTPLALSIISSDRQ